MYLSAGFVNQLANAIIRRLVIFLCTAQTKYRFVTIFASVVQCSSHRINTTDARMCITLPHLLLSYDCLRVSHTPLICFNWYLSLIVSLSADFYQIIQHALSDSYTVDAYVVTLRPTTLYVPSLLPAACVCLRVTHCVYN